MTNTACERRLVHLTHRRYTADCSLLRVVMSGPCKAACRKGKEFCDPVTDTCIHCINLCDPSRKTPDECQEKCSDYEWIRPPDGVKEARTEITLKVESNYHFLSWAPLIVVIVVLVIFAVSFFGLKKRRRRRRPDFDESDANNPLTSSPRRVESPAGGGGYCFMKCCYTVNTHTSTDTTTSNNVSTTSDTTCAGVVTPDKPQTRSQYLAVTPPGNKDRNNSEKPNDRVKSDNTQGSVSQQSKIQGSFTQKPRTVHSNDTGSPTTNYDYVTGTDYGSRPTSTVLSAQSRRDSLRRDGRHTRVTEAKSGSCATSAHCDFQSSLDRFSLDLESIHQDRSGTRSISVTRTDPPDQDHWNTVIRVYDYIDQKMHELPWIAGCMISNTALKVVVSSDKTDTTDMRQRVRNIIPPDIPSERFLLTFEGPALQTQHGSYGAGSMVHVPRQEQSETLKSATTTILATHVPDDAGRYRSRSFAFTVGHVIHKDMVCKVQSRSKVEKSIVHGKCLSHIDTVGKSLLKDIKRKIYDMATVEVEGQCVITNSRLFLYKGMEVRLRPRVSKAPLRPADLIPGRRVLIFGGPRGRTMEGCIDRNTPVFTCTESTSQQRRHQAVNLIQLSSVHCGHCLIHPGHSGSLVAWYPTESATITADNSLLLDAFAMVVGINADKPNKGFAIPLWEQICVLFEQESNMSDLQDRLVFEDQECDSGVFSDV